MSLASLLDGHPFDVLALVAELFATDAMRSLLPVIAQSYESTNDEPRFRATCRAFLCTQSVCRAWCTAIRETHAFQMFCRLADALNPADAWKMAPPIVLEKEIHLGDELLSPAGRLWEAKERTDRLRLVHALPCRSLVVALRKPHQARFLQSLYVEHAHGSQIACERLYLNLCPYQWTEAYASAVLEMLEKAKGLSNVTTLVLRSPSWDPFLHQDTLWLWEKKNIVFRQLKDVSFVDCYLPANWSERMMIKRLLTSVTSLGLLRDTWFDALKFSCMQSQALRPGQLKRLRLGYLPDLDFGAMASSYVLRSQTFFALETLTIDHSAPSHTFQPRYMDLKSLFAVLSACDSLRKLNLGNLHFVDAEAAAEALAETDTARAAARVAMTQAGIARARAAVAEAEAAAAQAAAAQYRDVDRRLPFALTRLCVERCLQSHLFLCSGLSKGFNNLGMLVVDGRQWRRDAVDMFLVTLEKGRRLLRPGDAVPRVRAMNFNPGVSEKVRRALATKPVELGATAPDAAPLAAPPSGAAQR